MLTSPLVIVFLSLVHNKVGLVVVKVLGQDPAHASASAIQEGFMLGFHACAPDGVGVLAFHGGDVVASGVLSL
jgi:hypothetical protein